MWRLSKAAVARASTTKMASPLSRRLLRSLADMRGTSLLVVGLWVSVAVDSGADVAEGAWVAVETGVWGAVEIGVAVSAGAWVAVKMGVAVSAGGGVGLGAGVSVAAAVDSSDEGVADGAIDTGPAAQAARINVIMRPKASRRDFP